MMLRLWLRTIVACGAFVAFSNASTHAIAQSTQIQSDFVVINQDRLYSESQFGQRVVADIRAGSLALAEENRRIEDALIAEEQAITERRPSMAPEEFRALADDFDARVTAIRAAQDRKARNLTSRDEQERRTFFNATLPVLGRIMSDFGAVAIFDQRAAFITDDRIDITDEAIAAMDEAIGTGQEASLDSAPAPVLPDVDELPQQPATDPVASE